MARIRTIKPGFFRHEGLYEAEKETALPLRVAFAGLWTVADKSGRFKWLPRELKLDCLPYDEVDFSRVLDALSTRGHIVKYAIGGKEYGLIPSWSEHQIINNRESESVLPEPAEESTLEPVPTREPRVNHASGTPLMHASVEGKGREGKGKEEEGDAPVPVASAAPKSRKPAKHPLPNDFCISDRVSKWAAEKGHANLEAHFENFVSACRKSGYVYVDWDEAFMDAVRKDWAKIGSSQQSRASPSAPQALGRAGQVTAINAQRWLEEQDEFQ